MEAEWDEGSIAVELADVLTEMSETEGSVIIGWAFNGLDLGEIEVTTHSGQMFRMIVTSVESFDV